MPGIHLHMHLQLFFTADYHPALAQSLHNLPWHTHLPFACRHPPPLRIFPHWSPVFLTTGPNTPEVLKGFWATTAQHEGVLCLQASPVLFHFKQKALILDCFFLLSWERLNLTLDKQELARLNWRINAGKYSRQCQGVSSAPSPLTRVQSPPLQLYSHHYCPSTDAFLLRAATPAHLYLKWRTWHQERSHKCCLSYFTCRIILHLFYKCFLTLKQIIFVDAWINEKD